jgi:hypothetical protein
MLMMSGADMSKIASQNVNLLSLPKPFDGQNSSNLGRSIPPATPKANRSIFVGKNCIEN